MHPDISVITFIKNNKTVVLTAVLLSSIEAVVNIVGIRNLIKFNPGELSIRLVLVLCLIYIVKLATEAVSSVLTDWLVYLYEKGIHVGLYNNGHRDVATHFNDVPIYSMGFKTWIVLPGVVIPFCIYIGSLFSISFSSGIWAVSGVIIIFPYIKYQRNRAIKLLFWLRARKKALLNWTVNSDKNMCTVLIGFVGAKWRLKKFEQFSLGRVSILGFSVLSAPVLILKTSQAIEFVLICTLVVKEIDNLVVAIEDLYSAKRTLGISKKSLQSKQ
jgi:hypothetical protein